MRQRVDEGRQARAAPEDVETLVHWPTPEVADSSTASRRRDHIVMHAKCGAWTPASPDRYLQARSESRPVFRNPGLYSRSAGSTVLGFGA